MTDWLVETLERVKVVELEDWPVEVAAAIRKEILQRRPIQGSEVRNQALADYDNVLGISDKEGK